MKYKLLNEKNLVISSSIIKYLNKNLSLNEFLVLLYFINGLSDSFNPDSISKLFNISLDDVMTSFNSLIDKELIDLETIKDNNNKLIDKVSVEKLYDRILSNLNKEEKEDNKESIFDLIEKEFDKKLSPIDMEIINGWFEIGTTEELIKCALKEVSYNGVKTLRYMDQLLYEWTNKGFKTAEDVSNYLKNKDTKNNKEELFDYNWLEDDE